MEEQRVTVVVGGQAGSEGKGAVTGRLHQERQYRAAVRVGGPNAGHSVVDPDTGKKFALRQIPVAAVTDPDCNLYIAAGSEVDPAVLMSEVVELEEAGIQVTDRLYVDPSATRLDPEFANQETGLRHGTTGKGIGAARAARALRRAPLIEGYEPPDGMWQYEAVGVALRYEIEGGHHVMVEGTQGYVLGSHAGYYPYCTSGDCRASDFLAAAGLPPMRTETWVVLRSFPIRIAGNSGPLEDEIEFEDLGVQPEYTTVTKKKRRIGRWNDQWAKDSVRANQNPVHPEDTRIALTFADYWWPEVAMQNGDVWFGNLDKHVQDRLNEIARNTGAAVEMVGTGPAHQLMVRGQKEKYQ